MDEKPNLLPFNLDEMTPKQRQELCLAASESLFDTITTILSPANKGKYDSELADYAIRRESTEWLNLHSQLVQVGVDEFEVNKDLVVLHPDHAKHEKHSRLSLRQLGAWVELQKHNQNTEQF